MADCTKTVEFLREWDRMCNTFDDCEKCPIHGTKESAAYMSCYEIVHKRPAAAIAIVQKWSDEHPVMTWTGKLKEAFPGCDAAAMITEACPGWVFGRGPNRFHTDCDGKQTRKCGDCWNGEYKEE